MRKALKRLVKPAPVVTVLRLSGPIGAGGRFGRSLDDASLAPLIERAFKPSKLAAVALAINSPGGAPAQSALIAGRIRDAAAKKKVPVLAFCEDVAASGGYMLACAADEIFVEENTIIGSIGVISASFGFDRAIERLGVDRRVTTAGENKLRLDPFQPQKPEDVAWLSGLQEKIHDNFIRFVKTARGARLAADRGDLFNGEVWVGGDGVSLGLADGVGRLRPTILDRFGEDVRLQPITAKKGVFSMFQTTSDHQRAAALIDTVADALEQRALWSRFGL